MKKIAIALVLFCLPTGLFGEVLLKIVNRTEAPLKIERIKENNLFKQASVVEVLTILSPKPTSEKEDASNKSYKKEFHLQPDDVIRLVQGWRSRTIYAKDLDAKEKFHVSTCWWGGLSLNKQPFKNH